MHGCYHQKWNHAVLRHSGSYLVVALKRIKRFYADQSGMTLIDMALSLTVIGLLTAGLIKTYDIWEYSMARGRTENSLSLINKAIGDYYFENGYYPCPAVATAAPNTPLYGVESCDATRTGTAHIGTVPFVALKISAKTALDGWGNRIGYTVSDSLSGIGTPAFPIDPPPTTDISMLRFEDSDPITGGECPGGEEADGPITNIHFVLASSGPNGIGSTTASGNPNAACTPGATVESENCNNDLVFRAPICAGSDSKAGLYDDVISFANTTPQRMWVYSTAVVPVEGKADPTDILSTAKQIGIGNPDAFSGTAQLGVDVTGNIISGDGITDGNGDGIADSALVSDKICDINGQNCFNPNLIAGPPTLRNDCSQNYSFGMRGIGNIVDAGDERSGTRVRCQDTFMPSAYSLCAPKPAIGFEGGKIKCAP